MSDKDMSRRRPILPLLMSMLDARLGYHDTEKAYFTTSDEYVGCQTRIYHDMEKAYFTTTDEYVGCQTSTS